MAQREITFSRFPGGQRWLAGFFVLVALIVGAAVAYLVSEFGLVALLVLPAAAVFVFAVLFPEFGLWALIFVTYTQLSNVLIKYHQLPSLAQPLAVLLLAIVLIRVLVFGDRAEGWQSGIIRLGMYGFVLFLSMLNAIHISPALTELVDFIKDVLLAVIVIFLAHKPARIKNAIWVIILAGGFMATIGAYQHLTGTYSNEYWGFGNWIGEVSGQISRERITGPFTNPNAFAQVLVVVVPLALDRLWRERSTLLRGLALWSAVAGGLAIFFTYSRGGFLALSLVLVLLLLNNRPGLLPLLLTGILGLFLLRLLPVTYTDRISTLLEFVPSPNAQLTETSFRGRLSENTAGWLMFRDHPILGVGLRNFPSQYQDYSRQLGLDPRSEARSPASLYVEIISEQGLVGLAAFAFLLWTVMSGLRKAVRQFDESLHPELSSLASAFLIGLVGYLTISINKNSAYSNIFWLLIGLAIAVANVALESYREKLKARQTEILHQGMLA